MSQICLPARADVLGALAECVPAVEYQHGLRSRAADRRRLLLARDGRLAQGKRIVDFESSLNTESVSEVLTAPVCVEANVTVREVFALLKEHKTGSVLICADRQLLGIFTERDALRLMARGESIDVAIETVMVTTPSTISTESTVGDAIRAMFSGGYRRLPVLGADGLATGVVKVSSIVHFLVEHFPEAIYNLPPVPDPIMQEREGS